MSSEILIQQGTGIGPFKLGQSFRDVTNLSKEFRVVNHPSSIEYSDSHPFHQHLLLRSYLTIFECHYELLLAFEPYLQNLHFMKLSLQEKDQNLVIQYSKESDVIRIGGEKQDGYKSMENLSQFLKTFKKKRFTIQDISEKQMKFLEIFGEDENSTKYLFYNENEDDEFHSLSSVQTDTLSTVTSEIPRVDTLQYKLKSVIIVSDTYSTQTHLEPSRNLTPIFPVYKYNSTHNYIYFTLRNRTHIIYCSCTSQEVLTNLGTPTTKYYTKSLHRPAAYFYNYKALGIDIMFSCNTHKVSMIVLHNNLPGHAHFNEYTRAFFTVSHIIDEDEYLDISSHTNWHSLSMEIPTLGELPSVVVSRQRNANSLYPFPPTSLVCLSKCCLLEIHNNGYISNVFISTNFSNSRLIDSYTHKLLNILKQTQTSQKSVSSPEEDSLTVSPFIDETPVLFDAEFSTKSNTVKYAYKKLPDLEEDYALYSYNPYLEPQPIPFKQQNTQQTIRTNYILKRIEASSKTARVKNRVKFDDIEYIPPCMQQAIMKKTKVKDETLKVSNIQDNGIETNGQIPLLDVAKENDDILDSDINYFHQDIDTFQTNGYVSRRSPTISEVTEATPYSTVTSDSTMYSLKSNFVQNNSYVEMSNGFGINPQLSLQSTVSNKSTKLDLSSQPIEFQILIENATEDEIDFRNILKGHDHIYPSLTQRLAIYSKILPFWSSGKSQQALDVLSSHPTQLSKSDPQFYSHIIKLFLTKEFNWTIKTSQTLLDSLLDWINIKSPNYQLETSYHVIQLIIKRFRVRLIGNEPTNKALKEQFANFLATLYHVYQRLETIINDIDAKSLPRDILKMITDCHHDLRLFKSKFPAS
ncbi:hypothetical protein LOD99_13484 [Oopsacas minuta]|uniref:Uncharacterized protein n=1 Tax=Oopsacas minuta TaxID=111878 RepID=A0AAV7KJK1_9METZ|nr:hypothetical protein LOD99_13484 [Oopsacas minuta]